MAQMKKLQVFVSSTYEDLKGERQAAVEAILTAGHIPAGMELFAASNESQMNAIRRWIDESDVYLLILGGRYGSIEPKSQKSYIHLEYDYAIEKGKPLFAVVIDDKCLDEKVMKYGRNVLEQDNQQKLKDFRSQVLTRLVRFWDEPSDIKLAVLETMSEFSRRDDLVGWIPGDEGIKSNTLTEEIARFSKENAVLREQITNEKYLKIQAQLKLIYWVCSFDKDADIRCVFHAPTSGGELVQTTGYIPTDSGKGRIFETKKGIIGKAFNQKMSLVENFNTDNEYRDKMVKEYGYTEDEIMQRSTDRRSYLCLPLLDDADMKVLGLIYFDSSKPGYFPSIEDPKVQEMWPMLRLVRDSIMSE